MKHHFLVMPLLIFALGTVSAPLSFAQTTPATPHVPATVASKKIYLRYILPSHLMNSLKTMTVEGGKEDFLPKGIEEVKPDDSALTLNVRGTAEGIRELENLCVFLDVKPRVTKVSLRLYEVRLDEEGSEVETLVQSPTLTIKNNARAEAKFSEGVPSARFTVTPHINGDNSVTISLGVWLSIATEKDVTIREFVMNRRMNASSEWTTMNSVSFSKNKDAKKTIGAGSALTPADYPLYRVKASVAVVE